MRRVIVLLSAQIYLLVVLAAERGECDKYFPTGMKWKEVLATPVIPLDTTQTDLFEIGGDTLIGMVNYKKVFLNNEQCRLWLREEEQSVWILTDEYPSEIKLYDFDWDGEVKSIEVLKEQGEELELTSVMLNTNDYNTIRINPHTCHDYILGRDGAIICGIGRVSELNRNSCLLGYKLPEIMLPGLEYHKVLWVSRNGETVFYSDDSNEWIDSVPEALQPDDSYLVAEGKQWAICINALREEYWTITYRLQGDTVINGKSYKIENVSRNEDLSDMRPSGRYMREEDGRVYSITDKDQRDDLVFDYSMEIGDTLFHNPHTDYYGNVYKHPVCLRLIAIRDTIMPNGDGRMRKCYDTEEGILNGDDMYEFPGNFPHSFIEDIGYTNRGLSSSEIGTTGCGYSLLYVKQGDTMLYQQEEGVLWKDNTNIEGIKANNPASPCYDLQGRLVANPTRGIYIKEGKKVAIK